MNAQERVWLDRLLGLEQEEQCRELQQLANTQPELHARLAELLANAAANSGEFMQPVLKALDRIVRSSMVVHEPGHALAGYRLVREIGRGGMSVVWLAERLDGMIERTVALKLPLYTLSSPGDAAQFAREKDVLAALTHPNIARLYDAGVSDTGQPFIVLEHIEGLPITSYCDKHKLGIRDRLRLALQALAAVDAAHRQLIVHLDLKPSNILVDPQGHVKLLDFGVAKLMSEPGTADTLSMPINQGANERLRGIALTPRYAAPEQVLGRVPSTLSDVYALGVLLHELLTGVSPYQHSGELPPLATLLQLVANGDASLPSHVPLDAVCAATRGLPNARKLRAMLAGDLDAIVGKAMSFEPRARYRSVERLGDDLRRFLSYRPVTARASAVFHTLRLFLRRRFAASIASCIGTMLTLAAVVAAAQQYQGLRTMEQRAERMKTFMLTIMDEAVPAESQAGAEVTASELLGRTVGRVRVEFAGEPHMQGELLAEIGRVYSRLAQPQLSEQYIGEALQILEATQPPDDPVLNRARALLAALLLKKGESSAARALATQALDNCAEPTDACARARAPANSVMSSIHQMAGNTYAAMYAKQRAVEDMLAGWGDLEPKLADELGQLAISQRNAGQPQQASLTMERALNLAARKNVRTIEYIQLLRNASVIDLDLGRYAHARARLQALQAQTADAAELVMQQRLLANVYLAEGKPVDAFASAQAAITAQNAHIAPAQRLFAQQAAAQARAMLGDSDTALQEIDAVAHNLVDIGYSVTSPEVLRARRVRGEILLRAGQPVKAKQQLEELVAQLRALKEPRILELGQTLELLGCAHRELGSTDLAVFAHRQARTEFETILPTDHPFFLRNTLYSFAALDDVEGLGRAASQAELSPQSIWSELLSARQGSERCNIGSCVLVLW